MTKGHLDRVYGVSNAQETIAFYDDWAATYDAEVGENGYATPPRCAAALGGLMGDKARTILDFGCGTGLSGRALRAAGFTHIHGTDLSEGMLEHASAAGCYATLWQGNLDDPFAFPQDRYAAITAIGVIGRGAAPLSTLDGLAAKVEKDGYLVFSFNDHTLEDPEAEARVNALFAAGTARLVHREYGPHLPKRGMKSVVYVLQLV